MQSIRNIKKEPEICVLTTETISIMPINKKDKIVIIAPNTRFAEAWQKGLQKNAPDLTIERYPQDTDREATEFVMSFNPPDDVFENYPNLKVVASMGAGVRSILDCPSLPKNVSVTKVVQQEHQRDMAEFVLSLSLAHMRRLNTYFQYQTEGKWRPRSYQRTANTTVGIMGFGAIGQVMADLFLKTGFKVTGWSRTPKQVKGVQGFYGENQKKDFLKTAQILICVLPLTADTKGILNREVFQNLPQSAFVINVGRGAELNETDLIWAIDEGHLSGAALDVFQTEPLPESHPFWKHEKIMITPHIAGNTHPDLAAKDVLLNYKALKTGKPFKHVIDRNKGY